MMCPKCGKLIDDAVVRCPDCSAEFDLQYAAPRVEPGPTKLQQTQPAVIPKSVPAGTVRRAPGWWIGLVVLGAVMFGIFLFSIAVRLNLL